MVSTNRIDLMTFVPNAGLYDTSTAPYMWNVNYVTVGEHTTVIVGWCLPHGGLLGNTEIVVNGVAFEPVRGAAEGVLAERYPWHPNAAYASFQVQVPHLIIDVPYEKELSIACRSKSDPSDVSKYSLDLLVADLSFQLPPPDVAARIGVTDRMHYIMFGRSIYRGFEKALKKNFGKSFSDYATILDWGCGSARVARHILPTLGPNSSLVGFDIDEFAVGWSNANVGQNFNVCATEPPLALESGSVDVAYAYSVFTHLADDVMRVWVDEMARVLKPGGIGLFTVLSENAMIALLPGQPAETLETWRKTGVYDSLHNSQLETIGVSGDYYRNVWFKKQFLASVFGRHFEIVDFIDTFHFYQDCLVVRRR